MAKEFKQWDKAFTKAEIEACRGEWLYVGMNRELALRGEGWYEGALLNMGYIAVSIEEARYAVYEAEGFRDWQLFRVAMKGLNTQQKVDMLYRRWVQKHASDALTEDAINEKHRIWNYIGALKRGGQLVEDEFGGLIINK